MAITLAQIDAQIDALVTSQQVNYQVGDKRFDNGDKLRQLMELRKSLAETPEVDLDFVQFDTNVTQYGADNSQTTIL